MTDVTGSAGVISFDSALVCSVFGWTSRSMNEAPGAVERFLSTVLVVVVASVVAVVASILVVVASGRIGLFQGRSLEACAWCVLFSSSTLRMRPGFRSGTAP